MYITLIWYWAQFATPELNRLDFNPAKGKLAGTGFITPDGDTIFGCHTAQRAVALWAIYFLW